MSRQRLILFVLMILLGVAVLWSYSAMPRPKTVSVLTFKSGQQAKPVVADTGKPVRDVDDGTRLKIGLLDKESTGFKGYRRNIFKPVFNDETVAVKPIMPLKPLPRVQQTLTVPVIIKPAAAPLANFTFLGFLKKGSVKTIFLAKENDIILVKKGDKFAGRYEAADISDQALTVKVTDSGETIVIPLVENLPLASSR
ncbi:MAG: type II secretion system protein PulP [Desulfuromonadaceae bacterium]|nr:type II secretion system protein PulP [Desulfuromonadaceae bacterium]MDD2846963.1 type II secretion system protein PulP [Desulfuromonadaceae bacterium]MDD4129059.1 type II secretion system protein PulP [Desulfuromonadaceae bacterium]